jgi:two-component system, response regulator YesN
MYNLLVVDDEMFAVKGISQGIDWSNTEITNIYEAFSVGEAKAIFMTNRVDILLCDIEMPGNNGIELVEWVKAAFPAVETIFLTGHASFAYAQKALKLECFDYILKPVRHEDLKGAVGRVIEKIKNLEKKDHFYEVYKQYYDMWDSQLPILIERFWQELLGQRTVYNSERLNNLLSLYNIPLDLNDKLIPILINVEQWDEPLSLSDEEIMEYGLRNIASELFLKSIDGMVLRDYGGNNCIMLYIKTFNEDIKSQIKALCSNFIAVCNIRLCCRLSCYIGEPSEFSEITSEYEKLLKMERNNISELNSVLTVNNHKITPMGTIQPPQFNQWSELFDMGKRDELVSLIDEYFIGIKGLAISSEALSNYYHGFIHMIYSLFHTKELSVQELYGEDVLFNMKASSFNIEQLRIWSINIIEQGIDFYREYGTSHSAVVEKILNYISEHVSEEFSREDIAASVYLNSAYMSRLFKKEVGMSISDYIINLRVGKAKEMLQSSGEKISEVALAVGYDNFSHFTKMFRKITGFTPQEYRKKYQ